MMVSFVAITLDAFVEMIHFFTTLILNVDESTEMWDYLGIRYLDYVSLLALWLYTENKFMYYYYHHFSKVGVIGKFGSEVVQIWISRALVYY